MPYRNPLVISIGRRHLFAAHDMAGARKEYLRLRREHRKAHPGAPFPPAKVRDGNRKDRLVACINNDGRVYEPGSAFFDWIKTKRGF